MTEIERRCELAWPYFAAIMDNGRFVIFRTVNVEGEKPRTVWACNPVDAQSILDLLDPHGPTLREADSSAIELLRRVRKNRQVIHILHPDVLAEIDAVLKTAGVG